MIGTLRRRSLAAAAPLAALLQAPVGPAAAQPASATAGPADLAPRLAPLLARHGLPALAAAVLRGGETVALGVAGTRRLGQDLPVTRADRFHIGSCTKAMTALLAGMLVEAGALRWDSRVGELFPELAGGLDPALRGVTLAQLLSHTSGLPADDDAFLALTLRSFAQEGLNLDELRLWMLREAGARPLAAAPGSRFAYSNLGYIIAGAMLERLTGRSWEELMVERIFTPLGLASGGFGPPSSPGRLDAPLGHLPRPDGTLKPMLAGPQGDNPLLLGPAGTVHLSVGDFAAWAAWNAGGARRGPRLVQPETLRRMQTPVIELPPRPDAPPGTPASGAYGLGWGMVMHRFESGMVLQHNGSNGLNLAAILLDPGRDLALVLLTNAGGPRADAAVRELIEDLYTSYRSG